MSLTVKKILLVTLLTAILGHVIFMLYRFDDMFGIDLRNRVIGARMLGEIDDLYFYPVADTKNINYFDPIHWMGREQNLITVPPSYLWFFKPVSFLGYNTIRYIWLVLEYSCLFGIPFLIFRGIANNIDKYLCMAVSVCCVCFSNGWYLHLRSGQTYILYALFVTCFYCLIKASPGAKRMAFLVLGVFSVIRFPLILASIPLWLKGWRKLTLITLLTFLTGLSVHYSLYSDTWNSYLRAMNKWSEIKPRTQESEFKKIVIPDIEVEGVRFHSGLYDFDYKSVKPHNLSVQRIARDYAGLYLSSLQLYALYLLLLAGIIGFLWYPIRQMNEERLLMLGVLMVILFEYFIAASRFSYNFVQWLTIFCLILKEFDMKQLKPYLPFLLAGVLLNVNALDFFSFTTSAGELLIFATVILLLKIRSEKRVAGSE